MACPVLTIRYQVEYKICIWKQMLFSQMYNSYQQANRSARADELKRTLTAMGKIMIWLNFRRRGKGFRMKNA
jgi:hypothetical protein